MSSDNPQSGVHAARRWIYDQFRSYSPRLEVSFDQYRVKKIEGANSRVPHDVDLYNIVAVLPGTVHPEQRILITAHYDTIVLAGQTGAAVNNGETPAAPDPDTPSPGVTDDGSGTACVMELARVMSQYQFDKTLVFITFSGEEEGLLGSTLYAARAKKEGQKIEAVLNNDIIGSDQSGSGRTENRRVSLFSDDPIDSASRTVARYVRETAEKYVPGMRVDLMFRVDRIGRGGDHTPFHLEGFGAVRFSSPQENFSHEHTATDTFDHTSPGYITRVTQINGAAAASLAWAPKSPVTSEEVERNGQKTTSLFLTRGESRYDARLRWKNETPEADLAGYSVVMRSTTAPLWEREIFVGQRNEYVLPDVSIDEWVFGVKAIDKEGNESLVSPYVPAPRTKRVVQVD
jgi:Zn-dependent M28 family amino/carboxypeptidase